MEPVVVLKPGEEDRLLRGHPWIYAEEIERIEGAPPAGAVAALRTSDGRELGVGHAAPGHKIAFRYLAPKGPIDAAFYREALRVALARREKAFPGETAYRLCFGESDGLPGVVVDRYDRWLSVQLLSAGADRDEPLIREALIELLAPEGILLRNDSDLRRVEGLALETRVVHGTVPDRVRISESGLKFLVPLGRGQKTGFYFDQRQNRTFAAPYCRGKNVLDLHCYVGAFALHAARAGAKFALGFDTSGPAIELANENARLNGLRARFEEGDGEALLKQLVGTPPSSRPEVVFIDPPNFVRRKSDLEQARFAYARLFAKGLKVLDRGGLLGASICSRYVTAPVFRDILQRAASQSKKKLEYVALRIQSEDHPVHPAMPETEYLHFGLVRVL